MKSSKLAALFVAILCALATMSASAIIMNFVPVGDPGNANDPATGFGGVAYTYGIGQYEVTLSQYTAFLNAVAKTDPYQLWHAAMSTDATIKGITRSGASGSYAYAVSGDGTRPVTYVTWFNAARFVNWLDNGQPTGAAGPTTTEDGTYTLLGAMSGVYTKNAGAVYWIPTENEWYKAAYYDPTLNSGSGGYWLYPTRSNTQPNSRNGSASDPNSANYYYDDGIANGYNGGFAVTQTTVYNTTKNYLTPVGAFSVASGAYNTFDQGGSVWEWNDAVINVTSRGLRGGGWQSLEGDLRSTTSGDQDPTFLQRWLGFRVAMIPEPSVLGFLTLGGLVLVLRQKQRSR